MVSFSRNAQWICRGPTTAQTKHPTTNKQQQQKHPPLQHCSLMVAGKTHHIEKISKVFPMFKGSQVHYLGISG